MAEIIAMVGLDAFNRVWTTPDLVPLKSETSTPELWLRRFR
ncbi:zinc-dependent metalloprotease [Streptomyces sp. M10(2022)]